MTSELFFDKYIGDCNGNGDHSCANEITSKITINDLCDGSFECLTGKIALTTYNKKFSKNGNFHLDECVSTSNMFKVRMYSKLEKSLTIVCVIVEINNGMLQKYLKCDKIPHFAFLKSLCHYHLRYVNPQKFMTSSLMYDKNVMIKHLEKVKKFIVESASVSVNYAFDLKINDMNCLNLKLFEYQKCSIYWMLQKEKNKKVISYNIHDEVYFGNVYYDSYKMNFYENSNKKQLTFHGGCIIDEVGLGKTIQMISLSLLNPSTCKSYVDVNHPYKLISKATLILCPNQLCKQWEREFKNNVKKRCVIIMLLTKKDYDKVSYVDMLNADFIIVSYQFLGNKCFVDNHSLKSLKKNMSISEHKSLQVGFDNCGKVLTSGVDKILHNVNPGLHLIHWHRVIIDEFHEIHGTYCSVDNLLPHLCGTYKWVMTATPFNKIECLHKMFDFLTNYENDDGENVYICEPFVSYMSHECFRRNTKDSVSMEHTLPPIIEIAKWLKFSTTERSIYNAHLVNEGNDKFGVFLRKLCCHPQLCDETKEILSNCKTLEDIEKMMVLHYKQQVSDSQNKIDVMKKKMEINKKRIRIVERRLRKKEIKKLGYDISSDDDEESLNDNFDGRDTYDGLINTIKFEPTQHYDALKESFQKKKDKLVKLESTHKGRESTLTFYTNVIERVKKTASKVSTIDTTDYSNVNLQDLMNESDEDKETDDEICGICLSPIPENDIGVTRCGHIFCFECLKLTVTNNHKCPACREQLGNGDVSLISYVKEGETNTDEKELINTLGTKLAHLILYLKSSNEHTIIFSQWDGLLIKIGRILKEHNIPNVFCKGHCFQRDKAIRDFNDDDKIKVIMLSSDRAAAGTNLTRASQIIFIDPIYGDYKYRKDQERQAIGRAYRLGQKSQIKVVRLLIKGSIEEEIYNMNLEEDKSHGYDLSNLNQINLF